ncbi:MAG TPA: Zn-dependent exopeptidase M28 [Thermoplasmatales archaeon]|nr:Zn-dependent exopeptidase M28 [Thermoplasmatales archaeon]
MRKLICFAVVVFFIFPVYADGSEDKIKEIIEKVDANILENYVREIQNFGTHPTGSDECEEVADFIYNELNDIGVSVEYFEWSKNGYEGKNIIATIPGETNSTVVITAHYDSYPGSPGADDDGSGVSCLLMSARILTHYSFHHTIKFVFFSGEEQDSLGSQSYVRYLYDRGEDIIADINVDTVGHAISREGGSLIRVLVDESSIWISDVAEEICNKYDIGLNIYRHGNFGGSDHQSFIDYGYEAIFFVEYEFNSNMHTSEDKIENMNMSYLLKSCKLVLATSAKIADMNFDVRIKIEEPRMGSIYLNDRRILSIEEHYAIIFGRILARARVDGEHIKRVEFYFDGKIKGFCENPPYEYTYKNMAFLKHNIKAVVVSNKSSDMSKIEIIVFNFLPAGAPH